jgi:hypothetical protein
MVDRLYDIEMQLHQLDPKRWPVPSMPKNKRQVRRKMPEPEVEEIFNSPQAGNRSVATIRSLRILQPTTEPISEEE